ncbi:ATP synthase subunit J, mitochondrial [Sparassis crispa]|uniref:ATP synthase subunit J, mitochondrial n=1 Tax=Sparassis crispa TaxID=139825 RepID=A0A401H703_9APHY|nr:ATP synthase subunit J, mitochondrial [Sparassis crispa]GBE90216.1 ATP synthase subunit J, mitochondrial [Sparassis crispa]
MSFLGLRKWPTPVARPLWPFIAAGSITFYLVSLAQDAGVKSETYAKDPRNPYAAQIAKESHH